MRADAIFIAIEVDDAASPSTPSWRRKLEEVCPVDIYRRRRRRLQIVEENVDECVLCRLCLDASHLGAEDAVKVIKLYDDGAVLQAAT